MKILPEFRPHSMAGLLPGHAQAVVVLSKPPTEPLAETPRPGAILHPHDPEKWVPVFG